MSPPPVPSSSIAPEALQRSQRLLTVFDRLDRDRSGVIDAAELEEYFLSIGTYSPWYSLHGCES